MTSTPAPTSSSSRMSTTQPRSGRKISKRACDGCKIRKIKCSEQPPCDGCRAVGLACTFNKRPATRGPRKLRTSTIQEIAQAQQQKDRAENGGASTDANQKIPAASLVLQLCIYRLRMYSVWPVVKVEDLIASLQRSTDDPEMYALANAVGAATIAQLKLAEASGGADAVSGERMEEECQKARSESDRTRQVNLTTLRTAFFLHIYHENKDPGGVKSLLFLRETITMAQMLRLDRESSYKKLPMDEQQIRRRILWLLFITERGVSMLHKLPVVLKPNIAFPTDFADDEITIFPAFQKLVSLFWIFDQSHAFDILQENEVDVFRIGGAEATNTHCLDLLQSQLQDISITGDATNDIQTADIAVTRQWMRAVLWKASRNHDLVKPGEDAVIFCSHPFQIAKDFLEVTSSLPSSALEAHGLCAELKIFEIATSVTDAIACAARTISWVSMNRPRELLNRLHQILSSTRGGNQNLVTMLRGKIAQITSAAPVPTLIKPSSRVIEEIDDSWDEDEQMAVAVEPVLVVEEPAYAPFPMDTGMGALGQQQQQQQQQQQHRSYSDSEMAVPLFNHRDSSSTVNTEPMAHMPLLALQQQHHQHHQQQQQQQNLLQLQHPQFMPYQWDAPQQGLPLDGSEEIYNGYGNGLYGQLQASDLDAFAGLDAAKFGGDGGDVWDDGALLDLLPAHDGMPDWQ